MRPLLCTRAAILPLLLLTTPSQAQTTTIVQTATAANQFTGTNGANSAGSPYLAQAFRTDSVSYSLLDIRVALGSFATTQPGNVPAGGVGAFSLYSDNGGAGSASAPGTLLISLGSVNVPFSGLTFYDLTPTAPTTLSPNTTYWVVGQATTRDFFWGVNNPFTLSGAGSIPSLSSFATSSNGATWGTASAANGAMNLRVQGTVSTAPEPLVGTLCLLGLPLLTSYRRR